jgi:hypothetical protein
MKTLKPKQHRFDKKRPDDLSSIYYSSFSFFSPEKVARMTAFQGHLMLLLPTKPKQTIHPHDGLTLYYTS